MNARTFFPVLLAGIAILLSGCAPYLDKIYLETTETRMDLVRLRADYIESVRLLNTQIKTAQNDEQNHFEILTSQLEDISDRLTRLENENAQLQSKIEELKFKRSANGAAATDYSANAGAEADTSAPDQDSAASELYTKALQNYNTGSYQQAVSLFELYLERYPGTDHAADANYWLGECYDSLDRSVDALKAYEDTAARYPAHEQAPIALFRAAGIYERNGNTTKAAETLRRIQNSHPNFKQMDRVNERLKALGE
ncbi:tetratricopeptide repeat protein [Candidatus Sumerlaeota bacterium]|nr:tetratricopeptide repeat protein [Candidatus Sumerlaeota bacterium]